MKGYDPKCLELAEYFLAEGKWKPEDKAELAEAIQSAVDDFVENSDFLFLDETRDYDPNDDYRK